MTAAAERGTTVVSDRAVRRIAGRAAQEVTPSAAGGAEGAASVHGGRADIGVKVALPFPARLTDASRRLQAHVTDRTSELTGLRVGTAHVHITKLLPTPAEPPTAPDTHDTSRAPRRWWSPRRLPTAFLALAAAVACGALAHDLLMVHLAHRPAAPWRAETLHWLERHGPDTPPVTAAAAALVALGIVMITLAVTPGRRALLTLNSPDARLRAAVDRKAVALLVRDAAGDVAGVDTVRVRVRRRRIVVRAQLTFGDRQIAHRDITTAAHTALDACSLRRTPRLRVKVRTNATAPVQAGVTDAP
ncbi:DUF6286 domain-containing Asp23/Gls24 family envelope stress response protein [Streptomyces sp. NPDC006422]|uniref:DUF6286 domain-containing Asp23/Gls24 family envelope stress response protein n=1 Tax=unclassified Streptomyces TaxID=2593676 RepID=UPI0033BBF348